VRCRRCQGLTTVHPCPLCDVAPELRPVSIRGLLRLEGPVQEAIHRLKYRGARSLAEPLVDLGLSLAGEARSAALAASPISRGQTILAVPLHRLRQRQRGYNQSALIAAALAARLPGLPTDRPPERQISPAASTSRLLRRLPTPPQVGRNGPDRRSAMAGAFAWLGPAPPPSGVLLVDDVVTTGATLLAAAAALRQAGAETVHCLALAQG
jgi:predicted amidophosphoribosyltransferase